MQLEDHIIVWGIIGFGIIVLVFLAEPHDQKVTIHSVGDRVVNITRNEGDNRLNDNTDKNVVIPIVPVQISASNPLALSVSDSIGITLSQAPAIVGGYRGGGGGNYVYGGGNNNQFTYALKLFEGSEESDGLIDLGQQVRAVANTNDPGVHKVIFKWTDPSAVIARTMEVPLDSTGQAQDIFELSQQEAWIVEADFGNGHVLQKNLNVTFFVIPESPVGAIALTAASGATVALFYVVRLRRRRFLPRRRNSLKLLD